MLFTKEFIVRIVRRIVVVGSVVLMATAVSGCVVRPLGWGHHGGHGYREGGYRSDSHSERYYRDEGRRAPRR